jgi:hypothetical protein
MSSTTRRAISASIGSLITPIIPPVKNQAVTANLFQGALLAAARVIIANIGSSLQGSKGFPG